MAGRIDRVVLLEIFLLTEDGLKPNIPIYSYFFCLFYYKKGIVCCPITLYLCIVIGIEFLITGIQTMIINL